MQESDQGPEKKKWERSMEKARGRVEGWKAQVARSERARDVAVEMLEDYGKRLQTMLERGELGSRKGSDGEDYPQLRIVYWGEIETGSMSLLCFEIDYGGGERARVGAWARMRSVWESCSLPFGERFLAWRRALGHGSEHQAEQVWLDIRACLKVLCADLELDLDFGANAFPRPKGDFERQLRVDEREWDAWVSAQGRELVPLGFGGAAAIERQPSEQEWAQLESQTRELLDGVARALRGEPSRDEGSLEPPESK